MADGSQPTPERPRRGDDDKPSWKVDPAPDGRGGKGNPLMPRNRRGTFIGAIVALLALNFVLALVTGGPADRTRIPYEPFFVDQVRAGNVQEISSQDQTIEGTLKAKATYTPPKGEPKSRRPLHDAGAGVRRHASTSPSCSTRRTWSSTRRPPTAVARRC